MKYVLIGWLGDRSTLCGRDRVLDQWTDRSRPWAYIGAFVVSGLVAFFGGIE